jgi:endonuclease YncB( thermonuclease family)
MLSCLASGAYAETIRGQVVAVADGDTLTVLDEAQKRRRVRLAEIDAPERKQPFGAQARKSLAEICLRKQAVVETAGEDRHGRVTGKVTCGEVDASTEQVRRGMAWVFVQATRPNSPLVEFEANARLRQIGLWAGEKPVAPWEWRAAQRPKKQ